jgi:hypothetical protein
MDDHLGKSTATIDFVSAKIRQQYRTFVTDFIWHAAAGKNAAHNLFAEYCGSENPSSL